MSDTIYEYTLIPELEVLLDQVTEYENGNHSFSLRGSDYIKWLQGSLNKALGLNLSVDGRSGPATRSAIRSFQRQHGLTVDGVAGAITKSVLRGAVTGVTPVQPIAVPSSASVNWSSLAASQRTLYVMELLINTYHFPLSGAAGLVGNLLEESGLIPNRVEGSKPNTPMRSGNFHGVQTDFSAIDIMNRNASSGIGPRLPGIGIAQWTTASRRQGLFQYSFGGQQPGTAIIFNMDAQVDYLVNELKTKYSQVYHFITAGGISLNDASDEVVYRFEVPGSVLSSGKPRHLLPRSDAQVQRIFARRRQSAQHAFSVYKIAHP